MVKPVWILEHDTFHENLLRLKLEIKQQGMECIVLSDDNLWQGRDWNNILPEQDKNPPCAIYYGSLQGAKQIQNKTNWMPGVWCDFEMFNCSNYYPYLYDYLLNQDHRFLPFGLFKTLKDRLYKEYGEDGCIFVRPDTGAKLFTGQIIEYERFERDVQVLGYSNPTPEAMVVVARPRVILQEFRVIMIDGNAVSMSTYKPIQSGRYINEVAIYAESMARLYSPQRCFVLDVAKTPQGLEVIELNSFSCSGWYKAELTDVVKHASRVAVEEWKEIFGNE